MSSSKKSPVPASKTVTNKKQPKSDPIKVAPVKSTPVKTTPIKTTPVQAATVKTAPAKAPIVAPEEIIFVREYWTGDSRDGVLVNGDGYHFFRMTKPGKILEAYECYELDDGRESVTPCPEMKNVHWIEDLGYDDFEILDVIHELEFIRIQNIANGIDVS
jgi:hypothetical protein